MEDPIAQVIKENLELSAVAVARAVQDVKAPPGIRTARSTVKGVDQMTTEMPLRPKALLSVALTPIEPYEG